MGDYNPHAPYIIGQEWAPIRDENIEFSVVRNAVEYGHTFTLNATETAADGRFYVNELPEGDAIGQVYQIGIYPEGMEDFSGPIQRVVIPCNNGGVTGAAGPVGTTGGGAVSFADGVSSPSDTKYIFIYAGGATPAMAECFFPLNSYSNLLSGKRIIGVNLLYSSSVTLLANGLVQGINPLTTYENAANQGVAYGIFSFGTLPLDDSEVVTRNVYRVNLGEIDQLWSTSLSPFGTIERLPFIYGGLQRLEISSPNRRSIRFESGGSTTSAFEWQIHYVALEVLFCEENRIAVGGRTFDNASPMRIGANIIPMRTMGLVANPSLSAGNYTVVVSQADVGALYSSGFQPVKSTPIAKLNGLREKYSIPPHIGVQNNIPFPPDETIVGRTFVKEPTHVLPQLSLHGTTTAPFTEVHVYGRQAAAPVYGTFVVDQEIQDNVVPAGTPFPQSRYYARRFGNTTTPLTLQEFPGSNSEVITPEEFDALPEVIDGWKEINLTWSPIPTFGGSFSTVVWSATNELAANRWEILGAIAPAISGIPGNLLNRVPSPGQLSIATYGAPTSGAQINLGWYPQYGPYVASSLNDETSDAFIIFAQSPATITGDGVSPQTQQLVGIGLDCGLNPCCVPNELKYNRFTWGLPVNSGYARDTFSRVVAANSWGNADTGQAWTENTTGVTWSVNGSKGLVAYAANSVNRIAFLNAGGPEQDIQADFVLNDTYPAADTLIGVVGRVTDFNNYYLAQMVVSSTGVVTLQLTSVVADLRTGLASVVVPEIPPIVGATRRIRFQIQGSILRAKLWAPNLPEPEWQVQVTNTTFASPTGAGVYVRVDSAGTFDVEFDDFTANPPDFGFGYYELQRKDTVETDFQTIMKATNVALTGFNDYEARVGVQSSYRIRGVDLYGFTGPFTQERNITLPAPGVTIGCDDGHLLLFTSNEEQDGSLNLAYSSVWESGRVEEPFTFAEAGFVQLQAMYDRDFFTAFRPTERGGEQFERTVLVQAAAIAPETLANFTSLRDMAWANVSYICVRDEDGNRWFATVLVPSGRVLRDRRLYLAPVNIIEVTDTPSPVDP